MKKSLLLLVPLVLFILFSPLVNASGPGDTIKDIVTWQWARDLGLGTSITGDSTEGLIRTLIFIALCTLLFKLAEMLQLGRGVAFALAFTITAISILYIPSAFFSIISSSYGIILSLLFLGIPFFLYFYVYHSLGKHPWPRFAVMAILLALLFMMYYYLFDELAKTSSTSYGQMLKNIDPYIILLLVLASILTIVAGFQAFSGLRSGSSSSSPGAFSRFFSRTPETPTTLPTTPKTPTPPTPFSRRPAAPSASGTATTKAPEAKAEKGLEKELWRTLKRVYRYNKKVSKEIEKAHTEALKGDKADKKKLREEIQKARKYEDKEVNFDALANDLVKSIEEISRRSPELKTKLDILNKMLQKELANLKEKVSKAESYIDKNLSQLSAILVSAKQSSEKIVKEILNMEADIKGLKKELEA